MTEPSKQTGIAERPVPRPTKLSAPFWEACRNHRLVVQRCDHCGRYVFIPQTFCPTCHSTSLSWTPSSGQGTVVTYTVVWRPQTPAFETPYVVAVVRLKEGYEMLTNIVGTTADQVEIGRSVRVTFVDLDDVVTLPCFELDRAFND